MVKVIYSRPFHIMENYETVAGLLTELFVHVLFQTPSPPLILAGRSAVQSCRVVGLINSFAYIIVRVWRTQPA